MTKPDLFVVAKIVGWFGLKGFLKIVPHTHSVDRLETLKAVYVGKDAQSARQLSVEEVRVRQNSTLLKLDNVDDRTAAEPFKNMYVFVDDTEVQQPPTGSYFVHDVIGCAVVTELDRTLGIVEDVVSTPGQDVWVIRSASGMRMIPAVNDFIKHVDIHKKKITVHLIDGLIDEKEM